MARRPLQLPPEARALVEQVRDLEVRAARVKDELERDLAGIRDAARDEREAVEKEVSQRRKAADAELADVAARVAAHRERLAEDHAALEALLESRVRGFEFIASAWADYELARSEDEAFELETKSHPAYSAAERVRRKGEELAQARRELKRAQWALALYEFHFPWLAELRDFEEEVAYVEGAPDEEAPAEENGAGAADPAQRWLSKEEFAALSQPERNQRALDRYLASRKTPWQVGRDYERYIGYLREQAGAKVIYQGIFAGLEDLGRDLIAETSDGIEVVQCKRWAKRKTIHEKHVFQLFGTVVAMRIEHPDKRVTGTFTTTTTLSKRAHQFAAQLGIRVEENVELEDYPRIKCNVGRDGQRIYHLPFDQQYDTTVIETGKGERWVSTVRRSRSARLPPGLALERRHAHPALVTVGRLRRRFRPDDVRVLFVGESPPAGDTFFYRANSKLYHATREAFTAAIPALRRESDFLRASQQLGCYLDDLSVSALNHPDIRDPQRVDARARGVAPLARRVRFLEPQAVCVVKGHRG